MDEVVMISDIAWIPRGVAQEVPDKVKFTEAELKDMIEANDVQETTDNDDSDEEQVGDSGAQMEEDKPEEKVGLRGSVQETVVSDNEEDIEKKYLEDYDKEDDERGMRGIAVFASNKDDPYITGDVDSEDEDEKEDFMIKPNDNMLAVAKIDKNEFTLEVYVYNEEQGDFYCHHDYLLSAPPLCLEPVIYDPTKESGKGNFVAVGTMESEIHIWDLDIVNSCVPFATLGKKATKKRAKRDGSSQGHKDAVLSLSWNKLTEHVLASGGADQQIILWDLDEAKPAQSISNKNGEVQTIAWHPIEATYLISGTMQGIVDVYDCRETDGKSSASWTFSSQVEKVIWNHFNPLYSIIATEDGVLRYVDMRKPGEIVWEERVHEGSIGGLVLSTKIRGLLNTYGHDGNMNVYKLSDDGNLQKVHNVTLALGALHSASFNPDVGTICAAGGSNGDLLRVVDLTKYEPVVEAFK